jgi:UDP-glucose 4-epimerase
MNILITGSSGYVGSNFINTFADKYNFVKFSLLQDTLDDLELSNIDIVLHCAALVHQKIAYDYEKYDDINVQYPIKLAKKAKESGVKQFILISTIAVYGEGKKKLDENTVCKPLTPYGKSKLEAERQLEELKDEDFTVSIVRPPMVYGKNAPGNMSSLVNLIKKVPVLPFGKIDNRRTFVYIVNLIYLINKIIEKKQSGIFLASDDKSLSTTELVELIAKELDKTIYLVQIPFFKPLLKSLKPSLYKRLYESLEIDNKVTKEILDIKNPYSVEHGIKYMISGEQR